MGEHRVSALGSTLRRYEDPADSNDPRIRDLVAALSTLEVAPPARAHFRAELREQLVAVTPRLVAEGPAVELRPTTPPAATKSVPKRAAARVHALRIGRPLAVVVGVFAVFAMLLGGAVWISQKSLPGDALYSLKRANENVQLSMTHGTERGKTYLSFASTRVDEVKALIEHASALAVGSGPSAAAGINDHTTKLINSTLGSADSDVRSASQLLTAEAVANKSAAPLDVLTGWAPGQLSKLQSVSASLPAGALHDRVDSSARLVSQAVARANALEKVLGCSCLATTTTDQLGPVPCTVCSATTPAGTTPGSSTPGQPVPGAPTKPGAQPATSGAGTSGAIAPGSTGAGSSGVSLPGGTSPPLPLPSVTVPPLPSVPLPSLPIGSTPATINSCGVSASLGPIGVGVGSCGIHIGL